MSFLTKLGFDDLRRLRQVVKRVHMRHYSKDHMTNDEADRIIEAFGEETMQVLLKSAVDNSIADGKHFNG
jgi:hypothetical protein